MRAEGPGHAQTPYTYTGHAQTALRQYALPQTLGVHTRTRTRSLSLGPALVVKVGRGVASKQQSALPRRL